MKRVCKPGGWVIAQEPDHGIMDCYPESFAYQKLKSYYKMLYPDALIGRKLESYFKQASLEQVAVQTSIASEMGHEHQIKRVFRLTGQAIGQALLGKQLLTYQELEDFTRELVRVEEDNTTFLLSTLFMAASGRA
jgi:hypothetical protein